MPNYIDKIYTLDQIKESTHTYSEDQRLELNLYLPPEVKENFPVVIWMPAGGSTKDSPQCVNWAKEFATRGYAAITPNVKEDIGDFDIEKQLISVSNNWAVKRWIRANKEEFNFSGKKIFDGGNSAGSLTAIQSAICAVYIKEVIHAGKEGPLDAEDYEAFFGKVPYNTSNFGERIASFASATISGAAGGYFDKYIIEKSDPNYGYIGDQDELFYKGALKTQDAYRLKNVLSTMTVYPGKGHNIGEQDAIIADLIPKFAALVNGNNPTL